MNIAIMTMPAGREIDAIVSDRIFGIRPTKVRVRGTTDNFVEVWSRNVFYADGVCTEFDLQSVCDPPFYSGRIALAWQVVEKMHELGWTLELVSTGERAVVRFYHPGSKDTTARIGGPPALAICRAALAVVTGDIHVA